MEHKQRNWFARHPLLSLVMGLVWIGLTLLSNRVDRAVDEARLQWGQSYMDAAGAETVTIDARGLEVSGDSFEYRVVRTHPPLGAHDKRHPVLLIHGAPGGASGFHTLAPEIARLGHEALWLDLPGFAGQAEPPSRGSVFEDYSADSCARILWRVLDELGVEQAHILGWSNGGAIALRMIEQQPERAASLVMLASVGAQETEGSGNYFFEHAKYWLGDLLLVRLAPFYPHFGVLGPASDRHAFLRHFGDTDQRPLRSIMESLSTPTLILHGRHDFLVSDWAAEAHHRMMPTSSLVMTPFDHFMPFLQPRETAEIISPFLTRHDLPDAAINTSTTDQSPRSRVFGELGERTRAVLHHTHWSLLVIAGMMTFIMFPRATSAAAALLVGAVEVDFGVATVALILGGAASLCLRGSRTRGGGWVRVLVAPPLVLALGMVFVPLVSRPLGDAIGGTAWALSIVIVMALLFVGRHIWTAAGRATLLASIQRLSRHEFWPAWLLYLCAMPALARHAVRRGPLTAGCCNPGISELPGGIGGGIVGESKAAIQNALPDHPSVLRTERVQPGDTERLLRAVRAYPVILKPDAGQRGFGVRFVRDERQAIEYAERQTVPFVVQDFHPGPHECGVFWCRDADNPDTGFIYGITGKVFPELTGDGTRSLEQLVWRHPRFRMQAPTLLEKLGDDRRRVLDAGESFLLSHTGNHSQGTMFTDRADLITRELSAVINRLALGFTGPDGGGFDIGRFDIRHTSDDALKRGEGFGIVELNGLTAEASHLYDPGHSLIASCRILSGQWDHAYRLGAWRRDSGVPAPRLAELLRALRHHASNRGAVRTAS